MKTVKFLHTFLFLLLASVAAQGQNTFTQVYNLLQTNCGTSGCHDGSETTRWDATLPEADVYASLVNANPHNTTALAKKDKLIQPGYPARSFLLRKIGQGISTPLVIDSSEGSVMPFYAPKLADKDIELVRQWILAGAPLTGNVVDTAMINAFYTNGIDDTYPSHDPPAPGEGFQIYVGKILVPPNTEKEFFIKYDPRIAQTTEVNRYETLMPAANHHFVLYTFFPGGHLNYPDRLRSLEEGSHGDTGDGIGAGPNYSEEVLPSGAAYIWPQGSVFDLNLHIRNTHNVVLGTDLYMNVYTQPVGTATDYMLVRNFPNFDLVVPPGGTHEVTVHSFDTTETRMWKIWMLYSHTHRFGVDYDIWRRNADGTKGEQVYEGWYNQDYTFIQGFYGWGVDAPFRHFDEPFLQVDPRLGFIHTAKYVNTTSDTVKWGVTSQEEMMVIGFQFMYGDSLDKLTSVTSEPAAHDMFTFYPNPAQTSFNVNYTLSHPSLMTLELTDMFGKTTAVFTEQKSPGSFTEEVNLDGIFAPGVYMLTLKTAEETFSKRIVLQQ